ncbi:LuxR C-terminal-related transcriptional regulator [Streptomyces sp. NPDC059063]|uniref:helix-turn-helix transcriptional regulator n=1 Tax=unclassified Streptomyces TaxID=2593676 RepID=UPI003697C746
MDDTAALAALADATEVIRAPLGETLPRLSAVVARRLPHHALAELAPHCSYAPFKAYAAASGGDPELAGRITAADLDPLFATVRPGKPWAGTARVGGADREVLAVASEAAPRGAVLVLVLVRDVEGGRVSEGVRGGGDVAYLQALFDLVTAHLGRLAAEAVPGPLATSRAASGERARVTAELGEAHAAALTGLLGVLRSRTLDDRGARAAATELAVSALVGLRADVERDQAVAEEPADQAFARLGDSLRTLLRHGDVDLDLVPPGTARRLPADIAHAARAVVRAVVLASLEQDGVRRMRVGWAVAGSELRLTVRDDGPGSLTSCVLGPRRVADRLEAVGGRLDIDPVPGWGTTVTAAIPLGTGDAPPSADQLSGLGARELEVLGHLARGLRNRAIARELRISESTVKFHVANILTKLGVASRGEAAARFHAVA